MRRFSSTSAALKRASVKTARPLELRPPVEARVSDVKTSDSHPLWQFFTNKQALRTPEQVSNMGESWSVQQLRRKSFDDLHTLWYVCLKEWNTLSRESAVIRQMQSRPGQDTDINSQPSRFDEAIGSVRTSMQNIRAVLGERYNAFRRGEIELQDSKPQLLEEFSQEFLQADSNSDAEVAGQMERFQYAFYGINPHLQDNIPSEQVIEGVYEMAKLKLERYAGEELDSIKDIREAFALFTAEHSPEGVTEACETIKQVRESGAVVEDEVLVLAELISATTAQSPAVDFTTEAEAEAEKDETK